MQLEDKNKLLKILPSSSSVLSLPYGLSRANSLGLLMSDIDDTSKSELVLEVLEELDECVCLELVEVVLSCFNHFETRSF